MTRHNKRFYRRAMLAVLLSCTSMALMPAQARAFGQVHTLDMSALAQLKTQVTTLQNQFTELTQLKTLAEEQLSVLGGFGSMGSLFKGTPLSSAGSQSDFYENMKKFAFDPCVVNLCQGGDNPVGTTDIEEASKWAMSNLFSGQPLSPAEEEDLREVRRRGVISAATNGVAMATITHNDLAGAGDQADALDKIAEASDSLRGDIRANSAIALASYKVQLQQLAILTSMLEVESFSAIKDTQIYHEDGGSKFPDAYLEDDFSVNDRNVRIKVTPPKQGSAGGSGLGGGLIQSIMGGGNGNPISNILSGAGLGNALPENISELAASVQSGTLPSINPESLNLSTIVADTASVTNIALGSEAPKELASAMTMVQTGLANGGAGGNATAMMGLAQSFASTAGNQALSAALNTASMALGSNTSAPAISFAQGVIRDLKSNGVTGNYAEYLKNQIAAVENGTQDSANLVLDSAAILSGLGSDPNTDVTNILQVDPSGVSDAYFQKMLADAIDAIATATGNEDLAGVADGLRSVDESDVEELRQAFSAADASPDIEQETDRGASDSVLR